MGLILSLFLATTLAGEPPTPDSAKLPILAPALKIVGLNLGMAAYNRYVRGVEYAQVQPEDIWRNLSHEWVWDDNNFEVNQIGHPIQGSMYYSFARLDGYGYKAGLLWTTFGSLQWEYFMETEPPALNDLMTTRLGGAALGEVTWRLAEYLSGESTGEHPGWPRRVAAGLVNPVFGFDRLLNGPSRRPPQRRAKLMYLDLSTGAPIWNADRGFRGEGTDGQPVPRQVPFALTGARIVHGDPFEGVDPFDHFSLGVRMSYRPAPAANVALRAQLWRVDAGETESTRSMLELIQNYDYLNSSISRLSSNSVGVEWMTEADLGGDWTLRAWAQPLFILLGAASTEYYLNVERDYNLGSGAGWKAGIHVVKPGFATFSAFSDRHWVHTTSGANGDEIIDIHTVEATKNVWRALALGVSYHAYSRDGLYDAHPDISVFNQEVRLVANIGL